MRTDSSGVQRFALSAVLALSLAARAQTPTPGQNVNMVSGRQWPGGDPFLQRQNEPSVAVSSRNPLHLLAGANDYRTVDLPLPDELPNGPLTGDAWLGLFKSFNGGQTWQSTLIPGYPQDLTPEGLASPLRGFTTASDPVVRSGTNGLFYYAGIAFNRATGKGVVFVSRFIDLNNRENGSAAPASPSEASTDPIRYVGTEVVAAAAEDQFLDKPWIAVDIPRLGAPTCKLQVPQPGGTATQTFLAGNVYIAYTRFTVDALGNPVRGQLFFSRSRDCGASWSAPAPLFAFDELRQGGPGLHQGITLQVDPQAGFVYAAWRRFRNAAHPDSILGAVSIDGGRNFTPGVPLITLPPFNPMNPAAPSFFDQGTTDTTFRTNSFPALAVDDSRIRGLPGRVYLAWSQRVPPYGDARIMMLNLPGSILLSSSGISLKPFTVDGAPLFDDAGSPFARGHQFMPQLTFTGGKLLALYYDMRLDHTYGTFAPASPFFPDLLGRFFLETRRFAGELPGNYPAVFTPFINDANPPLSLRRHTVDVVVAEAKPSFAPVFTVARVSRYKSGALPGSNAVAQLQVNPPALKLFRGGTAAFFGDYIDVAGQTFAPKDGGWVFNTAPLAAPVHIAAWTSNQDVRPPLDGNWENYTPVGPGTNRTSVFDPARTVPQCATGQEGMRNQNIYSSRITDGLLLSSPQNSKPLSPTLQRAFVVVLQNFTNFDKSFRLAIPSQPTGGWASFVQAPNTVPLPNPLPAPTTTLDVTVGAHAGIARSVFAVAANAAASITVTANEISAPNGSPTGGLGAFVVLNPDGTVPPLINPDGAPPGSDITSLELYDPDVANPDVANPNASKSALPNPDVANPDVANPDVANPDVANPDVANPDVANVNVMNPDVANPDVANPLVSDASYIAENKGNTSASYTVKLVGSAPASAKLQLILSKRYLTPVAVNCFLVEEAQNTLLANVLKPVFSDASSITDPDVANPDVANATFSLQPGESALITLRGNVDLSTMRQIVSGVTPVVVAQAANTGTVTPPVAVAPILITTTALPGAAVARPYAATLRALGGTPPYVWTVADGSLPPGLVLQPGGVISGTVDGQAALGDYAVVFRVTDARGAARSAALNITVVDPVVYYLRNDGQGNSTLGTISTSGAITDMLPVGGVYDALTWSRADIGFGPNLFYSLRSDAPGGLSVFGTLSTTGVATDRFTVGSGFNALAFTELDLGYGPNLFYYVRQDGSGLSIFGTISSEGEVIDRFEVGSGVIALAFARPDLGYGPNLFYFLRTDDSNLSTFGTISAAGAVADRFEAGFGFNELAFTEVDLGYGANLFYYLRSDVQGFFTIGTISAGGTVLDRFGVGDRFDALAFALGVTPGVVCYPDLPAPALSYLGNHDYTTTAGTFTSYDLSVTNSNAFPEALFATTSDYGPCGLNDTPSRSWVDIFGDASHLYQFCALGTSKNLTRLWFGLPKGTPPPRTAYITIHDRSACNSTYTSNTVTIGAP